MASKSWAPSAIKTIMQKNKEVICLYIDVWIKKQKFRKILVDFVIIIELIS